MSIHPLTDLSALLDGALDPAARSAVQAHVDSCASCHARLGELRSVSTMLAGLPGAVPRRSLIPALGRPSSRLAFARSLSALASGVFVFGFVLSLVLTVDPSLGGGGKGALLGPVAVNARAAAPNAAGGASTSAFGAPIAESQASRSAAIAARDSSAVTARASAPASVTGTAASPEPVRRGFGPPPLVWLALAGGALGAALTLRARMRRAG